MLIFDRPRVQIPDGTNFFFFICLFHIQFAWSGMWSKARVNGTCTPVTYLKNKRNSGIKIEQFPYFFVWKTTTTCYFQSPFIIKRVYSLKNDGKKLFVPSGIWTRDLSNMSKTLSHLSYQDKHTNMRLDVINKVLEKVASGSSSRFKKS